MHLRRITVSGYRSFSPDEPFVLDGLGRINILLGPNGVGKSNLGRLVWWLHDILVASERGRGHPTYAWPKLLTWNYEQAHSWNFRGGPMAVVFGVDSRTLACPLVVPSQWLRRDHTLDVAVSVSSPVGGLCRVSIEPRTSNGRLFFCEKETGSPSPEVLGEDSKYRPAESKDKTSLEFLALGLCELISTRWIYFHALRHPRADGSLGSMVREKLAQMFNGQGDSREWAEVRADLQKWLGRIFGQPVTLDVPVNQIRITVGDRGRTLPLILEDTGDGIAQYLFLLAGLRLRASVPTVVFIDEPEAHLHPGATLELLRIIEEELPHVQVIIATHSPAVVDALAPDWGFWRVYRDGNGASRAERVDTQASRIAVLDALGIHASQIFMARTVVWVEGPSDVIYYRALLAEVDPSLVAGRDYAFALFGGSNGAHFAVCGDECLGDVIVDVLRLAHRNVFVHDKDGKDASQIDRWREQFESLGLTEQALRTPGREVENLVLPEVLVEAARATVKAVAPNGRRTTVKFGDPIGLGPDSPFAAALANSVGGQPSKAVRDSVAAQLQHKKHQLAREVARIAAVRKRANNGESVFRPEAITWAKQVVDAIRR